MKKTKWIEVAKRGKAASLLWVDSFVELFRQGYFSKAHKAKWNPRNFRQFDSARWFGSEDAQRYQKILEKAVLAKKVNVFTYAREYNRRIAEYRKFANQYKAEDFSKYSSRNLARVFEEWFEHTKRIWSFAYDYIFLNKFLPGIVTSVVASKVPDVTEQTRIFGVLFQADKQSGLVKEKKDLLRIVMLMRKKHLSAKDQKIKKLLQVHVKKFAHLGLYYFRGNPYHMQDLLTRLEEYIKLPKKKFYQIVNDIREQDENKTLTKNIIKHYHLDEAIVRRIAVIKRWVSLSTYVDETYGYVVHKLARFWQEICMRLVISYADFYSFTEEEIKSALKKGKISPKLKKEAKIRHDTGAVIILENGKKRVPIGRELKEYARRERRSAEKIGDLRELKGQSASPGNVSGRVRIVFSVHDIPKVQKGDIMTAPSTNPTFVPAMERAKAIVTDEGGLLSHAAIVSRELKIPCIIGTKIATKVFKDGDMVEVDANKGVVKKLE